MIASAKLKWPHTCNEADTENGPGNPRLFSPYEQENNYIRLKKDRETLENIILPPYNSQADLFQQDVTIAPDRACNLQLLILRFICCQD